MTPNQPRRVSFGQMIACENPDCQIEWYHFECVGLKEEPVDPWFCPSCREPQPKKEKVPKKKKEKAAEVEVVAEGGDAVSGVDAGASAGADAASAGAGADAGGAGAGAGADDSGMGVGGATADVIANASAPSASAGAEEAVVTEGVHGAADVADSKGERESDEAVQQKKKLKISDDTEAAAVLTTAAPTAAAEVVSERVAEEGVAEAPESATDSIAAANVSVSSVSVIVRDESQPVDPSVGSGIGSSSSSSDAAVVAVAAMDLAHPMNVTVDSAVVDSETVQSQPEPEPVPQIQEQEQEQQSLVVSEPVSVPAPVIITHAAEHQETVASEGSVVQTTVNDIMGNAVDHKCEEHSQSGIVVADADAYTASHVSAVATDVDAAMNADESGYMSVGIDTAAGVSHGEGEVHSSISGNSYANVVSGYEGIASISNESMNGGGDGNGDGDGPEGGLQPL
jgi:hypothetical protein